MEITLVQKHKKALIFGISGQDGTYLAQFLRNKNYEVHGTTRNINKDTLKNLQQFNVYKDIAIHTVDPTNIEIVANVIKELNPDEIYNLSGQSSVSKSFLNPQDTFYSITQVSLNILESLRSLGLHCKFYNAISSECFGDTGDIPSNEKTNFNPCSPYGVAKSSAFWLTKNYRESYNLFVCSGILFNHESPLRPENFVTKKIIRTAVEIYFGKNIKLTLGDLSIERDWGWAPDYVEGMWMMLQHKIPDDFVICTGEQYSLEFFVENVFLYLQLDWKKYVLIDTTLFRVSELKSSFGDPEKANSILGWKAKNKIKDLIVKLVDSEIKEYKEKLNDDA